MNFRERSEFPHIELSSRLFEVLVLVDRKTWLPPQDGACVSFILEEFHDILVVVKSKHPLLVALAIFEGVTALIIVSKNLRQNGYGCRGVICTCLGVESDPG